MKNQRQNLNKKNLKKHSFFRIHMGQSFDMQLSAATQDVCSGFLDRVRVNY